MAVIGILPDPEVYRQTVYSTGASPVALFLERVVRAGRPQLARLPAPTHKGMRAHDGQTAAHRACASPELRAVQVA